MIWVNGAVVPDDSLKISVLDRTFEHGLGLFETLRTWNGVAPLLERHKARMMCSARALGIGFPDQGFPDARGVNEFLRAEGTVGDVILRITLSGGLTASSGAAVWMRTVSLPFPRRGPGAVVGLGTWEVSRQETLARHKTLNYWSRRLANESGRALGFEEVLSTSADGRIWEGSRTNLFAVLGSTLITPSLDGPIVPGVMRSVVLGEAEGLPLSVEETNDFTRQTFAEADEVFLTNSVRGVIPVSRVEDRAWPSPGEWTRRLQTLTVDRMETPTTFPGGEPPVTTVRDITRWLDEFAPPRLAEPWDNVGLLWGDPLQNVERVMTCLTVTDGSAGEAINERAELIVSHHPVLFKAVRRVVSGRPEGGMLWALARAGVSIVSPHTSFDNTEGGINDGLARRLGLTGVAPLRPTTAPPSFKVVVFTPESDRDAVLSAVFAAGAGRIGAYRECSFATEGVGTFFGEAGTNPIVGEPGRREIAHEQRLEVVCPADRLSAVLAAIRGAHSYEEPAVDVYPLHAEAGSPGAGRVGTLREPTTLGAFAREVTRALPAHGLQLAGEPSRGVRRVAVVCGAGDDFVGDAVRAGADVLVTGEARFHRALEAEAVGLGLIVAGHYATERPGVEDLADRLKAAFPTLTVWPSGRENDPLRPLPGVAGVRKEKPPRRLGG